MEEWKKVDVREVDMDTLVDIRDVNIDMDWPREKRIEEFIRQIKNPYCFKVGKVAVKVEFSEGDATFEDRVKEYLESL
ncbi:MAG: hypothetical protein HFG68_02125 [Hungatella sp.]|nr:hypothetical protein [Hungatella sp.]